LTGDDAPGALAGAAAAVVRLLDGRGESLATAESLTGGLVASTIVDVAGASSVFRGGLVVYATELKASLAGVSDRLLEERGPVDPDVALALAEGGRQRCFADWGLATTGVAGPEPQDGKPVGLVFVAVAGPAGSVVHRLDLDGGRAAIRHRTVLGALQLLAEQLHARSGAGVSGGRRE
jgi:nicotinamide-nucleotide amidase